MPDAGGNVTKESLLEYVERYDGVEEEVAAAAEKVRLAKQARSRLRKLIESAGHDLKVFDRTREMMALPYEQREAEFKELQRNLAWVGMPLGAQAEMFSEQETAVPPEIQVSRVRDAGRTAGKLGRERSSNPWPVGQLLHQLGYRLQAKPQDA